MTNIKRDANNFDIIRILFAWLVIISHSYVLLGTTECDWMCRLTGHYVPFSYFGVKGFITISGFLIFKSLQRSPNVLDYLWKRVIRIYPGLLIVLLLSIGMSYIIYQPWFLPFHKNPEIISYILRNLKLYDNQWRIHGVFDHNTNTAINGSLWTMGFEFFFYLVLLVLFPIRKWTAFLTATLIILVLAGMYGNLYYIERLQHVDFRLRMDLVFELGTFFMMGALIGIINWDHIPVKRELFYLSIAFSITIITFRMNLIWMVVSWPYIVLYIGQKTSKVADWIHTHIEDPSYGIYLYAFPVQQLIIYWLHPSVMVLLWTSTIVSFALGIASWKWIEKKTLVFKNLFVFKKSNNTI